ncbi:TPA: efflux RND transporter periplasmic adaptor subunit [Pseudomonas aeruginosa]|nr:efflux RND transporter periplasmic adaptor subunit [Pseudomonas aeruginosa]
MEQSSHFSWRYPLALAAVLVLSACGKAPETTQGMAAPKVSVAEVIEQPLNEWDEFTGRLEAPESVELRPRVSGYIDRVAFHEGALVKKGDLLFQIDPRPFEAEVKRLEAQLQQARAAQARSVNEAQRGERLRASNAISAELADARTTAAQEAKAAVAATQAQLDAARLNLSFTRITAPSEDGNPHLGRLDFLDNQVNPRTGTIRGRAVFDNAKGEFTPGLYVRLKLVGSKTYAATLIKDEAVGTDLGKKFVLVLDGDNKTVYRTVEMGPKLEGLRIVRSGLSKGDRIVVNGLQRVRPGMQVDPQKVEMASADTLATLARLRQSVGDSEPPKVAASKDNATRNEPRG